MKKHWNETPLVAFTVDVEQDAPPYFSSWRGIEEGMPTLLALLERNGVQGTFFVTGETAERYPGIIMAAASSHEIGCHGYDHSRFDRLTMPEQESQIRRATAALQSTTGQRPRGFRAPNFQYTKNTLKLLTQAGYTYDASKARYHRAPANPGVDIVQIANVFPSSILRLPGSVSLPLLRFILKRLPLLVLDFHPWELVTMSGGRLDIRYATGAPATHRLEIVIRTLLDDGAAFITMNEAANWLRDP